MTKRVKILVSILVAVIVLAGILVIFNSKNMKSSADVLIKKTTFSSLKHHAKNPFNNLAHKTTSTFQSLKHHHNEVKLIRVTGQVNDVLTKKPISGATVTAFVQNSSRVALKTLSDVNGTYNLNLKPGTYTLQIRDLVYQTPRYVTKEIPGLKVEYLPVDQDIFLQSIAIRYNIQSISGAGGTITPAGFSIIDAGKGINYVITPNVGYKILDVLVDNKSVGAQTKYGFSNVKAGHIISVTFAPIVVNYNISVYSTGSGIITPNQNAMTTVERGKNVTYTIKPNNFYQITDVVVDNVSKGAIASFTFSNVVANHTIKAVFGPANGLISGSVTLSKKPLGNNQVILTDIKTGKALMSNTDWNGIYRFSNLSYSNYAITVKARVCTRVLFWQNCTDKLGKQTFTISSGKLFTVPVINFN